MSLSQRLKFWYYANRPWKRGRFPYFGTALHLPPRSPMLRYACTAGIYERENTLLLKALWRPGTWFFDVGANLGFMSAPLLGWHADCRVASFEASPNSLPFLRKSQAGSPYRDRWTIIGKALGAREGEADFSVSCLAMGFLDGLKPTGRAETTKTIRVPVTTLDMEWERLGRPSVSILKTDIEGGDLLALRAGRNLLETCRPQVLTEWHPQNLAAYGIQPGELLAFADEVRYEVFACPHLAPVLSATGLAVQMTLTESFLLSPC